MRVEVLYFGILKELFGCERETLDLAPGALVADVLRLLQGRTSNQLAEYRTRIWKSLAVAVNREYASANEVLHDGDELALLPPVSGGCDEEV